MANFHIRLLARWSLGEVETLGEAGEAVMAVENAEESGEEDDE
jgi:hypothetical protein